MIGKYLNSLGKKSKTAAKILNRVDIRKRNKILQTFSKEILRNKKRIIIENTKDVKLCKREDLIDRLVLNEKSIESIRNTIQMISKFKIL